MQRPAGAHRGQELLLVGERRRLEEHAGATHAAILLRIAATRRSGTLPPLRAIATALLLAAGLLLGPIPAAAQAAGPGVTLFINNIPRPIDIPGERFSGGMSIRALLAQYRIPLELVTFVNVTRVDSGQIALTQRDFGATIVDNGTTTRFVRGATTITATDDTGPLQISVNGGDMSVTASASRNRIEAGESVTFSVRVRFAPPGAQLSYKWDFNDGSAPVSGRSPTHVFKLGGDYQPRVTVSGTSGSTGRCATTCIGTDDVGVTVGEPEPQPTAPPGVPGGTGTGSGSETGSGSGSGGSGGTGSGSGSDPSGTAQPEPAAKPKPKPKPKPEKPFGVTISGVLINDTGETVEKLPGGTAAGAPEGRRQSTESDPPGGIQIPLAGLLAMGFVSLGALRERRGVKLRLA